MGRGRPGVNPVKRREAPRREERAEGNTGGEDVALCFSAVFAVEGCLRPRPTAKGGLPPPSTTPMRVSLVRLWRGANRLGVVGGAAQRVGAIRHGQWVFAGPHVARGAFAARGAMVGPPRVAPMGGALMKPRLAVCCRLTRAMAAVDYIDYGANDGTIPSHDAKGHTASGVAASFLV
jgi:hypothetical protein